MRPDPEHFHFHSVSMRVKTPHSAHRANQEEEEEEKKKIGKRATSFKGRSNLVVQHLDPGVISTDMLP